MTRRLTARRAGSLAAALVLSGGAALTGCSTAPDGPEVKAGGAYVPQPVMADMAAGYLTLTNSGGTDDELTGVTSDISDDVQLHRTTGNTMRQVDSLPVPAGGKLELTRGGSHLMFQDLKRKPVEGEKVSLELHFAESGPIGLDVPVEATNHHPRQ
ncbi:MULTISPECIES: copper chaperone PCu(A)C [Streptomyces]|uniref:Copper chaperone PCu(A)C n=1 Tax=Streptomyces lycii TaxID=2654337 RepID=A0ABQ7FCG2_9ACTN|nr:MULTISPECIES: copper chaperone PCu(A)C [Streptomyces]KAF4406049.1 copper chaperone PCu(A)C [Streptomyces lycii]PGH49290.1 copper resistance protein CopZ [Streptomyces sp. Ru87]